MTFAWQMSKNILQMLVIANSSVVSLLPFQAKISKNKMSKWEVLSLSPSNLKCGWYIITLT